MPGPALAAVGFAEIDVGLGATTEFVRPPVDLLRRLDDAGDDTPVSLVFTRLRHDPTDRFRADPERVLRREFPLGSARSFDIDVTARLDQRASDAALNDVLGIDAPTSDDRVAGVASAAAFAAVDGDPATAWISPFAYPGDHDISFDLGATETIDEFTITQPDDDERFSTITQLSVRAGDEEVEAEVGPPDADGTSTVQLPRSVTGDTVAVRVTGFDGVVVSDRRYAEPVFLPVAISEISVGPRVTLPETVTLPCRDDLLRLDGEPVALRLSGDTAALLDGEPFDVSPCDPAALDARRRACTASPARQGRRRASRSIARCSPRPPREHVARRPARTSCQRPSSRAPARRCGPRSDRVRRAAGSCSARATTTPGRHRACRRSGHAPAPRTPARPRIAASRRTSARRPPSTAASTAGTSSRPTSG
ncbi:MAG: discoidin domain-containing protein [Ilumatobacteraceae bacterium]